MERDLTVSSLIGGMLDLLRATATQTAVYVLAIGGLGAFGVIAGLTEAEPEWGVRWGRSFSATDEPVTIFYGLVTFVVGVLGGLLYLKSLYATRRPVSPGVSGFWSYFGLAIVSGIGTLLGFILLIIPGIFVMIRWSASNGFLIGSGKSISESLSASWDATRGHGWPIFFAGLILLVAMIVLLAVLEGVASLGNQTIRQALGALGETLLGAVFMVFAATIYFQVDTEYAGELREVFA